MGRLEMNMRGISEVYEKNMRGICHVYHKWFNFRNFKFLYVISIQFQYVSNIIPIIGTRDELDIYMKTEGIKGDGFLRASVGYARIMMGYWEIVMDKAVRK